MALQQQQQPHLQHHQQQQQRHQHRQRQQQQHTLINTATAECNTILECDYLVLGTSIPELAFVDAMLMKDKRCSIILADPDRHAGGLWKHTPPYSKLGLPSALYGVGSLPLDSSESPSRDDLLGYASTVLRRLLQNPRLQYLPQTLFNGLSLLSSAGEATWKRRIHVKQKVVESFLEPPKYGLREAPYRIDIDALVVSAEKLPLASSCRGSYAILGTTRVAVESVHWLLQRGVKADRICWILQEDVWFTCLEAMRPDQWVSTAAICWDAFLFGQEVQDIETILEKHGVHCRATPEVRPTGRCTSCITQQELASLRSLRGRIFSYGRVLEVTRDAVISELGTVSTGSDLLVVDCLQDWVGQAPEHRPIFEVGKISLQLVREVADAGPPNCCLAAALIAYVEAQYKGQEKKQNSLLTPTFPSRTVSQALRHEALAMRSESKLWENREIASFLMLWRPSRLAALSMPDLKKFIEVRQDQSQRVEVLLNLERLAGPIQHKVRTPSDSTIGSFDSSTDRGCLPSSDETLWKKQNSEEEWRAGDATCKSETVPFDFDELDEMERFGALAQE